MPVRQAAEREATRVPMSFRVTPALRERLEDAASKSGRSLTAETEYRLQTSFEWERAFAAGATYDRARENAEPHEKWLAKAREFLRLDPALPSGRSSDPLEEDFVAKLATILEALGPLSEAAKKMEETLERLERK